MKAADPDSFKTQYGSLHTPKGENISETKSLLNKICTAMMKPGLTENDYDTLSEFFGWK